jgi:hypothetical protein
MPAGAQADQLPVLATLQSDADMNDDDDTDACAGGYDDWLGLGLGVGEGGGPDVVGRGEGDGLRCGDLVRLGFAEDVRRCAGM